jgi:hypothetical protein
VDEVRIPPAGDGFYAAGCAKLRRTHEECIAAMHGEEERLSRKLTDRERDAFAVGFHAPEYRAEISRLTSLDMVPPEEDEA